MNFQIEYENRELNDHEKQLMIASLIKQSRRVSRVTEGDYKNVSGFIVETIKLAILAEQACKCLGGDSIGKDMITHLFSMDYVPDMTIEYERFFLKKEKEKNPDFEPIDLLPQLDEAGRAFKDYIDNLDNTEIDDKINGMISKI